MPVAIKGTNGGSVILDAGNAAANSTLTLPNTTGTVALTASPTFSGTVTATTITSPSATALTIQSAGTTAMTIDTSQNVGIGTTAGITTVSNGLAINNATAATYPGLEIQTAGIARMYFNANNAASYITTVGTNPLVFYGNGSERMRIDSNGRLLVNTTNYFVNQSAAAFKSLSAGTYSIACLDPATSGSRYFADFLVGSGSGTEVGYIYYNGSVMVYAGTSDGRLKTNVVDANSAISDLNSIKIRSFDWIESGVHQKYGVVAQELQETAPEYVATPQKPDGMLGVDYGLMVPMLVKAIQELSAKNDALEARLAALEAK